jgi:hypothetical protein
LTFDKFQKANFLKTATWGAVIALHNIGYFEYIKEKKSGFIDWLKNKKENSKNI